MEGIAAIGVIFLLFTVLTQAATALIAHRAAQSAVAASAARVAVTPESADTEASRLEQTLVAIVPGGGGVTTQIEVGRRVVIASAGFVFTPPGPFFRTLEMEVSARVPLVVDP